MQLATEHAFSIDSTVDLLEALDRAWRAICRAYDATADLPELTNLFDGAELALPERCAETVVANMLLEVMEEIPRFSAWYKRPLGVVRDVARRTGQVCWHLSPATRVQWQPLIRQLAAAIDRNVGLILASRVLDNTDLFTADDDDSRALAFCRCAPPRVILVNRAVLGCSEIVCDACQQPFLPADR